MFSYTISNFMCFSFFALHSREFITSPGCLKKRYSNAFYWSKFNLAPPAPLSFVLEINRPSRGLTVKPGKPWKPEIIALSLSLLLLSLRRIFFQSSTTQGDTLVGGVGGGCSGITTSRVVRKNPFYWFDIWNPITFLRLVFNFGVFISAVKDLTLAQAFLEGLQESV